MGIDLSMANKSQSSSKASRICKAVAVKSNKKSERKGLDLFGTLFLTIAVVRMQPARGWSVASLFSSWRLSSSLISRSRPHELQLTAEVRASLLVAARWLPINLHPPLTITTLSLPIACFKPQTVRGAKAMSRTQSVQSLSQRSITLYGEQ